MAIKIFKIKKQKGYAILFAIIIISAISVVTAGLLNASYKQKILSSLANDSQIAFYQADNGAECALYLDRVINFSEENYTNWTCGGVPLNINKKENIYIIDPAGQLGPIDPYFRIYIEKDPDTFKTIIRSDGYNIDQNNPRAVQRSIEIEYRDI